MLNRGEELHRQISTNLISGSKKILHNSFWTTRHKISNAPQDVNKFNTSTFKRSNAPGDVRTNILVNFVINAKPKTFSVNKRKKHTSIFRSSHQINNLKPTLITSLKKLDDPFHLVQHIHLVQGIAKTASSRIKSISINVCLPKGRD
jgi:hypothetical protein